MDSPGAVFLDPKKIQKYLYLETFFCLSLTYYKKASSNFYPSRLDAQITITLFLHFFSAKYKNEWKEHKF